MSAPRPMTPRIAALGIVRRLRDADRRAYFAGGCVRDMLLRRRPDDYDVATDARPEEIIRLFRRTRQVGAQFGVVLVGAGPHWVEVATFRSDAAYSDGRHPDAVRFSEPADDAQRRDFTINGMFYDPLARRIIDYVDGQRDLASGVIRAIGEPQRRFEEDHLRMLRAVRFAARLGFPIESKTRAAIGRNAPHIARVSPERIFEELSSILSHPSRAAGWRDACELRLLPHLWAGAASLARDARLIERRLAALPRRAPVELAFAAILLGRPAAELHATARALRTSNDTRVAIAWLVERAAVLPELPRREVADLKLLMAHPRFGELLALHTAELAARGQSPAPCRALLRRARAIPHSEVAPPPLLSGDDLAALHLPAGPAYRVILERVYRAQLNGQLRDRTAARALARQLISELRPAAH
ncbi:MAG: CCA tRNA nucleotidyltransferase [Phycisphaerae bacterium]